ncbi:MAG: branched-chain amino acid ABC transporter permease, partial [Acidimicrobiales bacterium]
GFGAAIGAYATQTWHLDLSLALLVAGLVGVVVAVLVGLPALRLRGLFLAVTTLAFAMATSSWLLNRRYFGWIPVSRVTRPKLFGVIDLNSQSSYYYLCLACLGLVVLGVRGIRRSRTGRVLLALRENERGAQSFGVNVIRAKLTAFALSGFLAAFAGCLLAHLLQAFSPDVYGPGASFGIFTTAVVGGLGSLLGAALGALYLQGGQWFLPGPQWQQLASAAGVLVVLLIIPGGLGDLVYRVRDSWLRWVAQRHDIIVPSLLADIAQPGDDPDPDVIVHAEEKVEAIVDLAVEEVVGEAIDARTDTGADSNEEVVS